MNKLKKRAMAAAYTMLFATSFLWALTTIIIKLYVAEIPPFHFMFGRFTLAAVIFYSVRFRKVVLTKTLLWHGAVTGLFLFIAYYFSIVALRYTTASKAGFLVALSVLWVPIALLIFQRKRPNRWVSLSVITSLLGLYYISGLDGIGFNYGDLLALTCSLSYTAYIMYVDKYTAEMNSDQLTFIILFAVALLSLTASVGFESFNPQILIDYWLPVVVVAIFGTLLTTYFQTRAQQVASPEAVGLILLGEPLFTLIMAILLLAETVTLKGLLGGVLLIFSLVIAIVKRI